jgi:hypothetical protein
VGGKSVIEIGTEPDVERPVVDVDGVLRVEGQLFDVSVAIEWEERSATREVLGQQG